MQISPKARLVSLIVALAFMAGTLIGSGTYLIINHINNANATTETTLSVSGNLYNTNGTINTSAVMDFLNKLDFVTDGAEYKSPDIADRAGVTATNSFIFQMGYYVSPSGAMDTSKPITWQAVYARNGYLTIWMIQNYTVSNYNDSGRDVSTSSPFSDYSGNAPYSDHSNYSKSVLRDVTNNIYDLIAAKLNNFSTIVRSPKEANATWQATQTEDVYTYSSSNYDHHNGLKSYSGKYTGWSNSNWDSANPPYNDKFWIPSSVEVFNQTSGGSAQVNNGLWGLSATDRAFSTTRLDTGTSSSGSSSGFSSYCWLRSGNSGSSSRAMRVSSLGSAGGSSVYSGYGVRPAAHLSLDTLASYVPQYTISVTPNNPTYGTVSTSGGTYIEGSTLSVTATPSTGYRFVRWERNGTQVSTSASYTFTVSGSYTYTAIFEPATATISTAVSPTGTGTATGGGTYNINSQATLSATPASGYKFVGWQLNGAIVSTSASYTFTVSSSTSGTYTAIFTPATYTVIMETSGYPSLVGGLAGGFENTGWSGTYGTEHVRSGSYSLKITGNTSTPEVTVPTTNTVPLVYTSGEQTIDKRNHVFYFQYWGYQETRAGASTQIYWPIEEPSMGSIALGPAGRWNMYSFYGTRSGNSTATTSVRIDFDNANQAGTIWFDDFLMLDLTEIFGAGREPSKEWCDMHIISGTNTQTFIENISAALETRPGGDSTIYTFAGWSTTPKTTNTTNQTVQYSNGGTVNNLTNAGGSITLYGVWEYRPFARASATLGGEVRVTGNDLGTGTTSATVSYEAIPYTGYYLIGWYVGDMLYTENGTTYTGTTLTLPRATAEGVAVVPVFSTNSSATPSLSFDLDNNTAITASIGGEARIIGDTYSTTDTVTLIAAVQMQGYRFVGWYIDGIQVSTDETTILSRATVLGKIVQARFAPIDNTNMNDDTDNTQTDDFVFF